MRTGSERCGRSGTIEAEKAPAGVHRLLLDTNPAVAVLDEEPTAPRVRAVLRAALVLEVQVVVSVLTLAELLSKPGLTSAQVRRREDFCLSTEGVEFGPVAFDVAFALRVADHRRRAYPQKLPDCLQYACAERLNGDAIPSNDARFVAQSPVKGILTDDIDL